METFSFLGHYHTEEWKQQQSKRMQGNTYGKGNKAREGQPFTLEEQEADRQGQLRRYTNPLEREKTSLAMKKYYKEHPEAKERQRQQLLKCSHKCSVEKAIHISKSHEKLWQNPEYIAKLIASFHKKPTRPELQLQEILNSHFPDFKYNGDFRLGIVLGGMIPDFVNVNGKKEVIEVFGSYWHSPKVTHRWKASELGKVMLYNSLGYKCLVIWENELKDTEYTIRKIEQFSLRRMKHTI